MSVRAARLALGKSSLWEEVSAAGVTTRLLEASAKVMTGMSSDMPAVTKKGNLRLRLKQLTKMMGATVREICDRRLNRPMTFPTESWKSLRPCLRTSTVQYNNRRVSRPPSLTSRHVFQSKWPRRASRELQQCSSNKEKCPDPPRNLRSQLEVLWK